MTVVVGFIGADCAVMASDSEGTESGHTRFDVEKIWTSGSLLMGYSGNDAVREAIKLSVDSAASSTFGDAREIDRWQARTKLAEATGGVLRQFYSEYVSTRRTPEQAIGGTLLVIGRDGAGYWILEIDQNNTTTFYGDRGLQAIGSGGPAAFTAQGLLRHYKPQDRPVEELRLIAFRTVQTCIDVLGGSFGVGGHVQLWSCEGSGEYAKAGPDLLESLNDGLVEWTTIERESLAQVFGGAPPDEVGAEPGVPGPIENGDSTSL